MRGGCGVAWAAAAVVGVLGCGPPAVFVCDGDASCGPEGVCEPVGYCSFPDLDCPSGRRFGGLASAELANTCVGQMDPTGESGTPMPSTSAPASVSEASSTSTGESDSDGATTSSIGSSSSSTSLVTGADSSSSSGGDPLVEGLILHLPLEDDFAAMAGALDVSGNDLHAVCEDCPTSVPGRVGMAASFDEDAVLYLEDRPSLRPGGAFSISVWALDVDPNSGVTQFVVGKAISMLYNTFQLSTSANLAGRGGDQLVWRVTDVPMHYAFYVDNPLTGNAWHHLAGTWDGTTSTLWVDGEIADQLEAPGASWGEGPFTVGADFNDGMFVYWFRGAIDEVRFYDRALTPEEVATLAGR